MAQRYWTYYSLTGRPYKVEIYHGDDSGHLMIMVNGEITQISFHQQETKTYSFIIENQLLKLQLSKKQGAYDYILTPILPPAQDNEPTFDKHFWIPLILLLLVLNLALYFYKYL